MAKIPSDSSARTTRAAQRSAGTPRNLTVNAPSAFVRTVAAAPVDEVTFTRLWRWKWVPSTTIDDPTWIVRAGRGWLAEELAAVTSSVAEIAAAMKLSR